MWIRSFISGTAFETEDLRAVAVELLRSPGEFANVLSPFYGDENANSFGELLSRYLFITFQVIEAVNNGMPRDIEEQRERWCDAADDIAQFSSEINHNWQKSDWKKMFYDRQSMIENEAVLIFTNQFKESITQYYSIQEQALKMADVMAYGLFEQFPSLS